MKGELTEEEKRLDDMMEIERQKSIVMQQEIENQRREERYLGAMKVMEQIQENEQVCWLLFWLVPNQGKQVINSMKLIPLHFIS